MNPTPDIWGEVFQEKNPEVCFRKTTFTGPKNCSYRVEGNNKVMLEIVLVVTNKMKDVIFDSLEG